jgi:hypothetical protein
MREEGEDEEEEVAEDERDFSWMMMCPPPLTYLGTLRYPVLPSPTLS